MIENNENQPQESNELLAALSTQADELETTPEQAEAAEAEQAQQVAAADEIKMTAAMMTGMLETVLKLLFPMVELTQATREQAAEVLAPLLEKYGVVTGGKFAAELNAMAFFGMTGFGIYQQIAAHNDAVKSQQTQAGNNGEKSGHLTA